MEVDALALRMRPRASLEAADLGVRLCQSAAGSVYACYAVVFVPVAALALATFEIGVWLPTLILFWSKPWLDRTILFVLSRAAFGQTTTVRQLLKARGEVWGRQLLLTWTWRRLSPWRSFTQPVYQLEGLRFGKIRQRVMQVRRRKRGTLSRGKKGHGGKVTSRKQAIAIGLSEARRAGGKVPSERKSSKRSSGSRGSGSSSSQRKSA